MRDHSSIEMDAVVKKPRSGETGSPINATGEKKNNIQTGRILVPLFTFMKMKCEQLQGGEVEGGGIPSHPSFHRQVSAGSANLYVSTPRSLAAKRSAHTLTDKNSAKI